MTKPGVMAAPHSCTPGPHAVLVPSDQCVAAQGLNSPELSDCWNVLGTLRKKPTCVVCSSACKHPAHMQVGIVYEDRQERRMGVKSK